MSEVLTDQKERQMIMENPKSTLQALLATYGTLGTVALLSDVLGESLPSRRGRPTRDEACTRAVMKALASVLPDVVADEKATS